MPLRRAPLYRFVPALLLVSLLGAGISPSRLDGADPAAPAPPNVLVILADDLGYGDLACQGATDMQTPHLDRLFADGLRFDRFYANCCVCSPTRAALLTGCYPDRVGVPGVIRTHATNNWGYFQPRDATLPSRLAAQGYQTAAVGKWHLGLRPEVHPLSRGFGAFHGFLGDMMDDYYDHRRHDINYMRKGRETIDPEGHATDLFSQWARESIVSLSEQDQPWFLYLAYNAPHTPIQPPEDWRKKVLAREPDISPRRAALVALIEHMDAGIGRVLQTLEATGEAAETIVVFTSDNGGQLSVGANNGPLRDGKGSMYEGGLRVPFAVRWPGVVPAGSTTSAIASTVDLLPTLCDATGSAVDGSLDGISMLPLWQTPEANPWPQREVYFVRREGGNRFGGLTIQAVRRGPWKLLQNSPFEPLQLYNLEQDPQETKDLREEARRVYNEMAARLRLHIQAGGEVAWQKLPAADEADGSQ